MTTKDKLHGIWRNLFFLSWIFMTTVFTVSAQIDICDHPDMTVSNKHYSANRAPLQTAPMMRLPLGSVQAEGWLLTQLDLMANGQVGHLEEISKFLKPDNGWFGSEERGWEDIPNPDEFMFNRIDKLE